MPGGHQRSEGDVEATATEPSATALLEALRHPAFVLDSTGRLLGGNERAAGLFETAPDDGVGFDTLVRPGHRERVRTAIGEAADGATVAAALDLQATGEHRRLVLDCAPIDGTGQPPDVLAVARPVEDSPPPADGPEATGTAAGGGREAAGDASAAPEDSPAATGDADPDDTAAGGERVGAETAASEELLRRADIVDAVGDGAYVLNRDRRLVAVSERLASTLGRDREALVGEPLRVILTDDTRAAAVGLHEALLAGDRETGTVELTVLPDGETIPVEVHATAVGDGPDRVVVGVLQDISDRRRREHQLARHRDQLATLNRISEAVEGVVQGIVESATRGGIEETVCERLAASDLYRTVWIGRIGAGGLEVTVSAGEPPLFTDDPGTAPPEGTGDADGTDTRTVAGADPDHPARVAFQDGEPCVRRAGWVDGPGMADRGLAAEHGIRASMALPITHNDTVYGVLCLQSPRADAFSDREQVALKRLARVVGFAINAADTERLLHSGTTTELEFRARGSFLATLSAEAGPVGLRWTVPEDGGLRHYLEVEATAEAAVAGAEAAGAREVQVVSEREATDDEPTVTILEAVPEQSVAARLSDVGAVVQRGSAEDGIAEITARIAGRTDTRTVVEAFQTEFDANLKAKRRVEEPVETARDLRQAADERLTDRQSDVLRTAYLMGYFEWPRVHNAEEVADRMNITSATLHYHLRAAERNFLELFFDESPTGG